MVQIFGSGLILRLEVRLFAYSSKDFLPLKVLWDEGKAKWVWTWRHQPCGREAGELLEFSNMLNSVSLVTDRKDGWPWSWNTDGSFSMKVLSSLLNAVQADHSAINTLWSKLVPKKVNLFMWRTRRNFIPTRVQLSLRGSSLQSCSLIGMEDCGHALLSCPAA